MKAMVAGATLVSASLAAAAMAQSLAIQPGMWEIVSTTTAVDMPSAPPAVANMMRGKAMTIKHCITPQEAAEGPQAAMKKNKACTVSYHTGPGGRFSSEMVCRQDGGTMNATSSGTASATAFTSTTRMVMSGGMAMTMTSTASGHRIGNCKG